MGIHVLVHHEHEHNEVCDNHDHTDNDQSSICSHEHQCELCVLIQASSAFDEVSNSEISQLSFFGTRESLSDPIILEEPISASSPRGPPIT